MVDRLMNLLTTTNRYSYGVDEIGLSLLIPFLLTFGIGFTYQRTQTPSHFSITFLRSLFLFGPVTSVITLIIGDNFARALGIVGALSVIRFRNALKSPMDTMFLFWTLGVGLACGAGFFLAGFILVLFCGATLILLTVSKYGQPREIDSLFRVCVDDAERATTVETKLSEFCRKFERVSSLTSNDSQVSLTYMVRIRRSLNPRTILESLNAAPGIRSVQCLSTDGGVPI